MGLDIQSQSLALMQTNPSVLEHVKHPCKHSLVIDPEFNLHFLIISSLFFTSSKMSILHISHCRKDQLTYENQEQYSVIEQLLWRHCGLCMNDSMGNQRKQRVESSSARSSFINHLCIVSSRVACLTEESRKGQQILRGCEWGVCDL